MTLALIAVSANFPNIKKCLKTQERTRARSHFSVMNMKFKVVGNQKMIAVCEVLTAVLTAVSANF